MEISIIAPSSEKVLRVFSRERGAVAAGQELVGLEEGLKVE